MELLYSSMALTLLLVVVLVKLKPARKHPKLPPGPWQLPVIGSIHHMLGILPHHALRALSQIHGPVTHLKLGESTTIVISSPQAATEILKTLDVNFATRPITMVGKTMFYGAEGLAFAPYGNLWRQLRKICVVELLSSKRVQSFRATREEEVEGFIRSIAASETPIINLSKRLYLLSNDVTVRTMVGGKCEQQAAFLAAMSVRLEAAGVLDMADLFPSSWLVRWACRGTRRKQERISSETDAILEAIIQERKKKRSATARSGTGRDEDEDLLDVLLRVQEEGNLDFTLTDNNIKSVVNDLFAAGTDTSAITMIWAMTELMRNPMVMKKAQSEVRGVLDAKGKMTEDEIAELSYLKLVVKETLRLHVPLPMLNRECQETCQVLGYEIPAKAKVVVNSWGMGRDPLYWGDDAEEFKPERFQESSLDFKGANLEFIPFGAGRRMCPGMTFGIANVDLVLANLLAYFDWKLPQDDEVGVLDMEETFGLTMRKKIDLRLHAISRISCHGA